MERILEFLDSNSILALIVCAIIFFITLVLVMKRIIGFVFTLILLAVVIATGYAILNKEIVRSFLLKHYNEEPGEKKEGETDYKKELRESYETLKKEFEEQKQKYQNSSKPKETPPENQPPKR